jgi:hypothetical protein
MATRQLLRIGAAVAGAAAVTACASGIRSERDEAIPVPHGATWAWGRIGNQPDTGRYIRRGPEQAADPIVQQRFRRAIEAAMSEHGFRQVADSEQPDFILSYAIAPGSGGAPVGAHARAAGAVSIGLGWGGGWGWGYGPGFYPGFGYYRPGGLYRSWGFYAPWQGYAPWRLFWGDPFFGAMWVPVYGATYPVGYHSYGGYGEEALVVELRLRSSGDVAWEARYPMDPRAARRMSQEQVQDAVNRLFKSLG